MVDRRVLHVVADILPPGGGWVRGRKKVCVPKVDVPFRAALLNFVFWHHENVVPQIQGHPPKPTLPSL